jgi:competence protein ComEC
VTHLALPLVSAVLAFLAGLLMGLRAEWVTGGTALVAVPLLLAPWMHRRLIGQALRGETVRGLLLAAFAIVGAGQGAEARLRSERDCRARLADGAEITIRGALAANWMPPADPKARRPLLPVDVEHAERSGAALPFCAGEMRVRLPRGGRPALAGTELVLRGQWRTLPRPVLGSRWPRDPGFTGYLSVERMTVAAAPSYRAHPLLTTRGRTERQLHRLMGRHGPLADALLLGRRETLDRELADRFAKTGLVHLLAISGGHVALIGAVFVLLGRMARLPRDAVAWLTILLVAVYLAVIGAPASAVRAGIMLALVLVATVLQRPSATLAVVAATAFAILALEPMTALDIGFQLSFAGVLGIILLHGAMMRRLPKRWKKNPAARWLAESLSVSVAAFAITAPVVAHHFGQVAWISIAANLPAIPLTSLALIGIGAAAALEPLAPPLARLSADGAGLALDLLSGVVDVAIRVPGGHAAVSRPQWWLWGAAGLVFLLAMDAAGRMRGRVRWAVAALSAAGAFLLLPLAGSADRGVEIAFIDVGQGDAVAIRTPAGRWLLVDAGERDDGWDAGERRVLPYLRGRGARRIEALVLTHPHADHIGGAGAVMRGMEVERVIEPGVPTGSAVYLETLRTAEARGVEWAAARQDRSLQVDGVEVRFLWPTVDVLDASADPNDISVVTHVRYAGFSALLTGDAPAWVEERLVARYGAELRADVLKAGHHGSRTSSATTFLDAVRPELVVVSAGARNDYGHPHAEVMGRMDARGIGVARTDRDGTVRITVRPGGAEWRVEP